LLFFFRKLISTHTHTHKWVLSIKVFLVTFYSEKSTTDSDLEIIIFLKIRFLYHVWTLPSSFTSFTGPTESPVSVLLSLGGIVRASRGWSASRWCGALTRKLVPPLHQAFFSLSLFSHFIFSSFSLSLRFVYTFPFPSLSLLFLLPFLFRARASMRACVHVFMHASLPLSLSLSPSLPLSPFQRVPFT